jgi:hypothetical protein
MIKHKKTPQSLQDFKMEVHTEGTNTQQLRHPLQMRREFFFEEFCIASARLGLHCIKIEAQEVLETPTLSEILSRLFNLLFIDEAKHYLFLTEESHAEGGDDPC